VLYASRTINLARDAGLRRNDLQQLAREFDLLAGSQHINQPAFDRKNATRRQAEPFGTWRADWLNLSQAAEGRAPKNVHLADVLSTSRRVCWVRYAPSEERRYAAWSV
jgi:hypothetical protein